MQISLLGCNSLQPQLLSAVLAELNCIDGPLKFKAADADVEYTKPYSFEDFFNLLKFQRNDLGLKESDFLGLLTFFPNEGNWFSAFDGEQNNFFVHCEDWEYFVDAEPEVPIAYQVIANFIQKKSFGTLDNVEEWAHQKTIGCINDMCEWKADVALKMRTADICSECYEAATENGGLKTREMEQLLGILEHLRRKSLHVKNKNPVYLENSPPPIAYTKRRLMVSSDPKIKSECLINHFDSLVRFSVHLIGRTLLPGGFENFLLKQKLGGTPSLGHWVNGIKSLSKIEFEQDHLSLGLPGNLREILESIGQKIDQGKLVERRNESAHSYVNLFDGESYESLYDVSYKFVSEVEKLLEPVFAKIKLCQIKNFSIQEGGKTIITHLDLKGNHTIFPETKTEIRTENFSNLISEQFYALCPNNDFYSLHDSMLWETCNMCGHKRFLISDGKYYLNCYEGNRFLKSLLNN